MEILGSIKSVLDFLWMVFFSIVYFFGITSIVWLVIKISYNRKAPERGEPYSFWRFLKVYLLFPFYALLLLINVVQKIFKGDFDSFMVIFCLLLFQHVDKLIYLYGGTKGLVAILMLVAFILTSLVSHLSIKNEAIKAIIELKEEQELEEKDEEMGKDKEDTQKRKAEAIIEKINTKQKENH